MGKSHAQIITGTLPLLANQEITLEGFEGLNTYSISKTIIDSQGYFKLTFTKGDYGIGHLKSSDNKPFFVILIDEEIELKGESLLQTDLLRITHGLENQKFEQYAKEQPRREQALSAWAYLENIYSLDSMFDIANGTLQFITKEKNRILEEEKAFLSAMPHASYARWYLPIRKLVSSVSVIAQYRTEELPETISAFRRLDYTDNRLYKSGMFKEVIESHFWLLENSGRSMDSVYLEMNISIDSIFKYLIMDEKKLNELTDYLFDLLERHSLFQASEYLALKVLNEVSCTVDHNLSKQLETYRVMKIGNKAPDIKFTGDNYSRMFKKSDLPVKLSDLKSKYTVVVFGASWCHKCTQELPLINKLYAKWKEHGVEVIFVSLDSNNINYMDFVQSFDFLSTCDYKIWESPIVSEYYVFAMPTMYVLDEKREILLRPNSVKHLDAWVNWFLIQGN